MCSLDTHSRRDNGRKSEGRDLSDGDTDEDLQRMCMCHSGVQMSDARITEEKREGRMGRMIERLHAAVM